MFFFLSRPRDLYLFHDLSPEISISSTISLLRSLSLQRSLSWDLSLFHDLSPEISLSSTISLLRYLSLFHNLSQEVSTSLFQDLSPEVSLSWDLSPEIYPQYIPLSSLPGRGTAVKVQAPLGETEVPRQGRLKSTLPIWDDPERHQIIYLNCKYLFIRRSSCTIIVHLVSPCYL